MHEVKEIPTFDGAAIDAELRALVPPEGNDPRFEGYGVMHNWTHVAGLT